MRDFVLKAIEDASFLEALSIWGFFLFGPAWLLVRGGKGLWARSWDSPSPRMSIGYMVAGLASYAVVLWFLISFGGVFLSHTRASVGPWVFGLLIAIGICAIALPIGYSGFQLRTAWELKKRPSLAPSGRAALRFGVIGVASVVWVAVLLLALTPLKIGLGFTLLATVALVIGWFGRFLVPDVG